MDIENYRHLYKCDSTYYSIKKAVKRCNVFLGLEPETVIHIDEWQQDFDLIVQGIIETMEFPTNHNVYNNLIPISRFCKMTRIDTDWAAMCRELRKKDLDFSGCRTARPWNELLVLINDHIKNNTSSAARIICICYKHGYVLKISEIANTHLLEDRPDRNFLDLETCRWTIRTQKNRKRPQRSFYVSGEFLEELCNEISSDWNTLIGKTNDKEYSKCTMRLPYFGIPDFSVREIRTSWEKMANEQPDQKERRKYSALVLGHDIA